MRREIRQNQVFRIILDSSDIGYKMQEEDAGKERKYRRENAIRNSFDKMLSSLWFLCLPL